jgi:hypothetical protein
VQGQVDVGVANHISETWTVGQTIEAGEAARSLLEHPGWGLVMDLVDWAREVQLAQVVDVNRPLDQAEYAMRLARVRGASLAADTAAAIIERAERAVERARETAALEASVEGS